MIFNKELDESLRLILENDKRCCCRISNFIRSIPNELFEQMRIKLREYEEYKKNGIDVFDMDDFCLRGECLNDLDRKYSFIIDMFDNSITISRYLPKCERTFDVSEDDYIKTMEITLYEGSRYNDISKFRSQSLGRFFDSPINIDRIYSLNNTFFGNMMTYVDNLGLRRYQRIDTDVEYEEEELSLENLCSVKKNVKVRKKG